MRPPKARKQPNSSGGTSKPRSQGGGGASGPPGADAGGAQDEVDLEAERLSSMEEMLRRMKERTASLEANANAGAM